MYSPATVVSKNSITDRQIKKETDKRCCSSAIVIFCFITIIWNFECLWIFLSLHLLMTWNADWPWCSRSWWSLFSTSVLSRICVATNCCSASIRRPTPNVRWNISVQYLFNTHNRAVHYLGNLIMSTDLETAEDDGLWCWPLFSVPILSTPTSPDVSPLWPSDFPLSPCDLQRK